MADVYPGSTAARAFATLSAVTAIVPVLAPTAGGLLAHVMSWRGMFLVLAGAAVAGGPRGLAAAAREPASRAAGAHRISARSSATSAPSCAAGGSSPTSSAWPRRGGILFAYIGASSFVLENVFGLSPQAFSLVFAGNSVGLFAVTWLARHLVGRVGAERLLLAGQLSAIAGAGVLALGVARSSVVVVVIGLFAAVASLGLVMPMSTSLGMAQAAGYAGSGSGVIGISQFTAGAIASPLAGLGGSAWSLVVVVAVSAVGGLVLRRTLSGASTPLPVDNRLRSA